MTKWMRGSQLTVRAQQQALAMFVHRHMVESPPTDADWLATTDFAVRRDGMLHNGHRYCRSHQPPLTTADEPRKD